MADEMPLGRRPTRQVTCLACGLTTETRGNPTSAQALEQTRDWFLAHCPGDPLAEYDREPGMRCRLVTTQ